MLRSPQVFIIAVFFVWSIVVSIKVKYYIFLQLFFYLYHYFS